MTGLERKVRSAIVMSWFDAVTGAMPDYVDGNRR